MFCYHLRSYLIGYKKKLFAITTLLGGFDNEIQDGYFLALLHIEVPTWHFQITILGGGGDSVLKN